MSETRTINHTSERPTGGLSGGMMLLVLLGLFIITVVLFVNARQGALFSIGGALGVFGFVFVLSGFYALQPNEAVAITLFGTYQGTDRQTGLRWLFPWKRRQKISLRVRNKTSETLKVNDKRGNPIEIAFNVVWRVSDSAQALFDVDDYLAFMNIQMETALREVARHYAYDHGDADEPTLRADAEVVGERLRADLQDRVKVAGIAIDETHLMHLAYAAEIAGSMLKRQQAEAVLAARQTIVAGAVGMVENALAQLSERGVVTLDDERKANMVSNLMVVLCADREAQPVLNTGSLY